MIWDFPTPTRNHSTMRTHPEPLRLAALSVCLFVSLASAAAAANGRQTLRDHPCRRRRHVALGQHGHDPGHGTGDRLLGQHHGPLPLVQGDRRLCQGPSRTRLWHPPHAQLRVEGISLGSGRAARERAEPRRSGRLYVGRRTRDRGQRQGRGGRDRAAGAGQTGARFRRADHAISTLTWGPWSAGPT